MPIMDGFESVRRYRAFEQSHLSPGHKPLFILGMSANNDDESIKEAIAAGMDGFIAKPFNYEKLAAVLIRSEAALDPKTPRSVRFKPQGVVRTSSKFGFGF
jgi:two-component system sensor histidine kinase/response regulator